MTILVLAVERIDTWVFRVAIAIPIVSLAGLALWHLIGYLGRRRSRERKALRSSPEPEPPPSQNDPERLERSCAALVESLAEMYLRLAESWLRDGQPQQAVAALKKIIQRCPEARHAQAARDRLRQLGAAENDS
jgi:hypothetical protein